MTMLGLSGAPLGVHVELRRALEVGLRRALDGMLGHADDRRTRVIGRFAYVQFVIQITVDGERRCGRRSTVGCIGGRAAVIRAM